MAIRSVYCPVLDAYVTQVTDLEGAVTRVICEAYDQADGKCRRRESVRAAGPLSQLLERLSKSALDTRSTHCALRAG
jgi:hypothetical protein